MRHSKAQNASYSRGTIWIKRGRSRKTPPQPWLGREDIQYCVTAHWYYKSLLHKNMDLTELSGNNGKNRMESAWAAVPSGFICLNELYLPAFSSWLSGRPISS